MSRERLHAVAAKVEAHLRSRLDTVHEIWNTATINLLPPAALYGYRVADLARGWGPSIVIAQVWSDGGFDLYVPSAETLELQAVLDGVVTATQRGARPPEPPAPTMPYEEVRL
jgi:hypothetical protein